VTMLRKEEFWLEYDRLQVEEEDYYVDSKTGEVKKDFSAIVESCLGCGNTHFNRILAGYRVCSFCGTINSHPRLKREYLEEMWSEGRAADFFHKFVVTASIEKRQQLMRERRDLIKQYIQSGKILEIGSSIGIFIDTMKESNYQIEGVEVLPFCIEYNRNKGNNIYPIPFEEIDFKPDSYDGLVLWEVIAHIHDPVFFMSKAFALLRNGGYIFLSTPNANALEYDSIWKEGKRYHDNLKPHIFFQIFSREGIISLLSKIGFSIISCETPGKMDVENIRNYSKRNGLSFNSGFWNNLFLNENNDAEDMRRSFQKLLVEYSRSGHMIVVARKINIGLI